MPRYRRILQYLIYYWSAEGKPLEPLHFHVAMQPGQNKTKVWILTDGSMQVAYRTPDVSEQQLNRIMKIMSLYIDDYTKEWETFFGEKATYYKS